MLISDPYFSFLVKKVMKQESNFEKLESSECSMKIKTFVQWHSLCARHKSIIKYKYNNNNNYYV